MSTVAAIEYSPGATRRLRICFVTETYPPEVNGVAMAVGRLVNGLLARGHPPSIPRGIS